MVTKHGNAETQDSHDMQVDLKPFINFLVVLIPVLMISAEFSKIAVVTFDQYPGGGQTDSLSKNPAPADNLRFTVFVSESTLTIGSRNGFLPSLYYKELHLFTEKGDRKKEQVVEFDPKHPQVSHEKDSIFTLDNQGGMSVVKNPGDIETRPLSVYDALKCRLIQIKNSSQDAADCRNIIIASENKVVYDKIIQIMDVAREAGFSNVSISKVRG
jgi:biopolymer transport protein ExbD